MMNTTNDETEYSYVTYGMLHKHHEFVDWVRVDLGEDDKVKVQKANSNNTDSHHHHHHDDSFKDMDERAFEKFKTQWQEISASDATASPNSSPTAASGGNSGGKSLMKNKSKDGLRGSIKLGKKLLASASAKTLSPDSISYGVFDADWNPVKLTPRVSNVDVAILLHAANEEGKNSKQNISTNNSSDDSDSSNTNDSHKKRTYLTPEALDAGLANSDVKLPIVPVRRSTQQQFLIKQSVQLFFRKDSIEFFACFPLRYSPRTIYRFDMIHGGIDRTFWQKMKMKNVGEKDKHESKPTMNAKLIEMRSKVAINTANLQLTLASNTLELKNSLNSKVSTTRESFLNLKKNKKMLSSNSKEDNEEEKTDDKAAEKTTKSSFKLSKMRFKMASAATMRSSFQSRVSTRKDSLFKMNKKTQSEDHTTKDEKIEGGESGNAEAEKATTMTTKLSQMKLRMSENTTSMKNNFATKVSTTKESLLKINKGGVAEGEGEASTDATATADKKMPVKLSQMKLRMSGLLKKKKNDTATTNAAVGGKEDEPTTTDLASISTGDFSFTIDDEDDDDVNVDATSAAPTETEASSSSPAGYVALSLDDAPCRFDDRSHSQMENVLDLLKRYDAKVTFMVISSFLADCHEPDMIRLLKEGHELANHGVRDEAMDKMATSVDIFVEALEECNSRIVNLQKKANMTEIGVKWFRAPQSRYTKIMEEGLVVKDMHNVMCDAYAACPIVEDGPWIASTLSKQIKNGSIACLHMPEKCGFREHCLEAMEALLEDLQKRNFKVVTIGELHKIAESLRVVKQGEDTGPKEDTIILA
jgi:peptidoglycan/xylan/chitin deacetylase (PgdA/CDA1 family)